MTEPSSPSPSRLPAPPGPAARRLHAPEGMGPWLRRYLPMTDLAGWRPSDLGPDLAAGAAVTVLSIPQGLAYALMAGLPPATGLYASMGPAIVSGLFRSSRFVVAGPTNALSLLVAGAVAGAAARTGGDPASLALTLALLVGVVQMSAGALRLGALVDYISTPVVLGYITGAAALIAFGQLGYLTGTPMGGGDVATKALTWLRGLGGTDPTALALGLGTTALVVALRRVDRRIPGALVAIGLGIGASELFGLPAHGLKVIADISPVPGGLPPFTVPRLDGIEVLVPAAIAATVLSLVESTSVARSIATRTGERLDNSAEFFGQGLANVAAAFGGGYPVSGSLGRSVANWRSGAHTRLAGVFGGGMVVAVVALAGPLVNHTPLASLAGLLLVLGWDLVDRPRIRQVFHGGWGDRAAFVATLVGAFLWDLDKAIALGVLISIVLFLRRARLVTVAEIAFDPALHLREVASDIAPDEEDSLPEGEAFDHCPSIRILHVEGSLFFGAATELGESLDEAMSDEHLKVLVVRLKRCQGLDVTTAEVLASAAERLRSKGRHLVLVGMRPKVMERMEALGIPEVVGRANLFPTEAGWFVAMDRALGHALALVGHHEPDCVIERYLRGKEEG